MLQKKNHYHSAYVWVLAIMNRLLLLLILTGIGRTSFAQYVYTIKADSVKITNSCDTAELIIENHTQTVPGFLFNKGRGRTEFRKVFQNLTDNTFLIGGDTMRLSNVWMQGGNRFGATGLLGTNDNYPLSFLQNGTERGRIENSGNWLFNTTQDKGYLAQFNGNIWTSDTIYTQGKVSIAIPDNAGQGVAISIGRIMNVNVLRGLTAIGLGSCTVTSDGYYAFGAGQNNSVTDGIGILGSTIQGIALGMDAFAHPKSIVLGGAAESTAENQFVCGGPSSLGGGNKSIENVYFGSGPQRGNKVEGPGVSYTINGSGALGNNYAGGNITIAGGKGTGSGTPGSIIFSTAQFTSSGTDLQELTEKARITDNGNFGIGTSTPINKLDVHGTARVDNVLSTSGHRSAVRTISSDIAIGDTDEYLFADATNNPVTVTLPPADGRKGQTFTIKKIAGSNSVYVATAAAENVDGINPYTITGQYKYVTVVSSGNAWMIVSQN